MMSRLEFQVNYEDEKNDLIKIFYQ